MKLSLTRLTTAVGGVAIALTAGAGIASADPPGLDRVINTHCTYTQVMAALNAADPAAAAEFNQSAMAQGYLRQFLASPPPKRAQMAAQIQAMPGAAQYFDDVRAVADTCNGYPG